MIKDGKEYFLNPWYNREVQMPEFAGVEWGEAGRRAFITAEEQDQINAALTRYHERKLAEGKAIFEAAMIRQKRIAEEGEIDRLAALSRRVQQAPPPADDTPPARPAAVEEPPRAAMVQRQAQARAPAGRGQPIRVVINSGPLNLSRITARIVS